MALDHRRRAVEAQIEALRAQFKIDEEEFEQDALNSRLKSEMNEVERSAMAKSRRAGASDGKEA